MCKHCHRVITLDNIKDAPELRSDICNWCNPQQIPLTQRLYIGNRIFVRKNKLCPTNKNVTSCIICHLQGYKCSYKKGTSEVTVRVTNINDPRRQVGN